MDTKKETPRKPRLRSSVYERSPLQCWIMLSIPLRSGLKRLNTSDVGDSLFFDCRHNLILSTSIRSTATTVVETPIAANKKMPRNNESSSRMVLRLC